MTATIIGASIGLGLVLWIADPPSAPIFMASFGGSTIFLFALSRTPAAQPRALFGGHLIGFGCGVLCFYLFGNAIWVYLVAFLMTLVLMLITKTVHPPAGANPLIVMQSSAPLLTIWQPVLLGLVILFVVAIIWSRLVPGIVHYPYNWTEKSPPSLAWGGWID